mmetsp:Transcript_24597/g.64109  ORF Transcript_24597/g.64109 Transcript_24597/m.64109 type:complete len:328 (-) Transcript_24597:342-1325(-)
MNRLLNRLNEPDARRLDVGRKCSVPPHVYSMSGVTSPALTCGRHVADAGIAGVAVLASVKWLKTFEPLLSEPSHGDMKNAFSCDSSSPNVSHSSSPMQSRLREAPLLTPYMAPISAKTWRCMSSPGRNEHDPVSYCARLVTSSVSRSARVWSVVSSKMSIGSSHVSRVPEPQSESREHGLRMFSQSGPEHPMVKKGSFMLPRPPCEHCLMATWICSPSRRPGPPIWNEHCPAPPTVKDDAWHVDGTLVVQHSASPPSGVQLGFGLTGLALASPPVVAMLLASGRTASPPPFCWPLMKGHPPSENEVAVLSSSPHVCSNWFRVKVGAH